MWWYISILSYAAIGFGTFRVRYTKRMAKALFDLYRAKADYEEDKKRNKGYASPGAEYRVSDAKRRARSDNHMPDSIALGIFWFVYIFIWLAKLAYWVLFRGDVNKAARQRSQKLIAEHKRIQDLEAENARLMKLAEEEGLIEK